MIESKCPDCGAEKEEGENAAGALRLKCPNCDPHWDDPIKKKKYRCRGCWLVKLCVAHHVSYNPEIVVPMCNDCHEKLHRREDFLPHLTPDMKRRKAERDSYVTINGLVNTNFAPVEVVIDD